MAKVKSSSNSSISRGVRPALLPENREAQLVSLAMDVVEQRLRDGTATSQETTHFLKLGSIKARAELEKIQMENRLAEAKIEQIKSQESNTEMIKQAFNAFKIYSGNGDRDDEYEDLF